MARKVVSPKTADEAFDEALEFYKNAKGVLNKSPVEFGAYKLPKYVKEASSMVYLAALRAMDGYLLSKGIESAKLPTSIVEYENALKKVPKNGRLRVALNVVYQNLHMMGYYRGGVGVEMIKEGFKRAKEIIEALSGKEISSNQI